MCNPVYPELGLGRQEVCELCVWLGAHLSGTELGIPYVPPNCTVTAAECLGQHLCGLRFWKLVSVQFSFRRK